jgi:hypothetical protein
MKVMIGDNFFDLEVAEDHEKGLSGRDSITKDGMIFIFPDIEPLQFHMKDCKFPLDIIFCKEGEIVNVYENCPPCEEDCTKYACDLGDLVIELPAGACSKKGIKTGGFCQIA